MAEQTRPRISPDENEILKNIRKFNYGNWLQAKTLFDKKLYKVLIFSDPHGWLADLTSLRCINQVLQHHNFDEVMIAGDLVDLPYISRHEKKLYEDGVLQGYSEIGEINYTKEQILAPLRHSVSDKTKIRFIPGNHDERITKPHLNNLGQLARLAVLNKEFKTTEFEIMLDFKKYGIEWDGKDVYDYFDKFTVVHGLSLAKNASEKNIMEYMGSGASGHSHRLQPKYITNRKNPYVWFEVGCTRVRTEVEYFPTGKIPDWQNGFVELIFYKEGDEVYFFGQCHVIVDGMCCYQGVVYNGNKIL
jgi:predicted phosphodiesterase